MNDLTLQDIINIERGRYPWYNRDAVWEDLEFLNKVLARIESCDTSLRKCVAESKVFSLAGRTRRNIGALVLTLELIALPIIVIYVAPSETGLLVGLFGSILGGTGAYVLRQHNQAAFYRTLAER